MPDAEVSGEQARALGLIGSSGAEPLPGEVSGERATALGLPTSTVLNDPTQEQLDALPLPREPIKYTPREWFEDHLDRALHGAEGQAAFEEHLAQAAAGAVSSPEADARRGLALARDWNSGSGIVMGRTPELEAQRQSEIIYNKLAQLPRLASWMAQSAQHAAAVQSEVDQWGTLDYVFGKYTPDPHAVERAQRIAKTGKYESDRGTYEPPGWVLALGRAGYNTSTSVQMWAQVLWGRGKEPAKIQQERDIGDSPVPGDTGEVLRHVNAVIGMTPLVAAAVVHPGLAFGLIYAETSGRAYEDLRQKGYDHESASGIANLIGFSVGSVGAATGPMFKPNFFTKPTLGSITNINNALFLSMTKDPTIWNGLWGLGKNFFATMVMNTSMAASEAGIKEAFDSARAGKPYDWSKVVSASADAASAWSEIAALSVLPAYHEHRERESVAPAKAVASVTDARRDLARQIYTNYEERGRALRSMQEAANLTAAVEAVKQSDFMQQNPQDARELIQTLVAPRASQTVFVAPEAFKKMSAAELALLGNVDLSLGQAGHVPVNIVDFLAHPNAESILPHVAGEADLHTIRELTGIDLTQPPEAARGQAVPDEQLAEWLAAERERRNGRDHTSRIPTSQEVQSAVQGARQQRRPPPDLGPEPKEPRGVPDAPETPRALRDWARDAVARRPTGELEGMAVMHGERAKDAAREALNAQYAATHHAEAGRAAEMAATEATSQQAQRRANVSTAVYEAATEAVAEVKQIGEAVVRLSGNDRGLGNMTPRERAWYAGSDLGEGFDALMEMLGASKVRGYAAPDLSDLYDRLARTQKLPVSFDLPVLNRLLRDQPPVSAMSLQELREVRKALAAISTVSDAENWVRVAGIQTSIGIVKNQVAEHLRKLPDVPVSQRLTGDSPEALKKVESRLDRVDSKVAPLRAMMNAPHTLFFKLGKVGESLWFDQFIAGVSRENALWGELSPKLKQIHDSMPEELRSSGSDVVPGLDHDVHLRSDVWHLALQLGVEGADAKIARGLGVKVDALHEWVHGNLGRTVEDAHAVMSKLIEPHWKLFGGVWSHYERHFKERGLAPPEKLRVQPLTIWGKQYSGGYGGRLQWLDLTENKPILHPGSLEALLESDVHGPAVSHPHLIERDPSFGGKPLLNWDGVSGSLRKEIHDIALRPFVEDAHKIFSNGELRGLLADKMGKDALNEIFDPRGKTSFLHTIAHGSVADVHSAPAFTRTVMKLQGVAAYAAFSLNFRVIAGQLSHVAAAVPALGINPVHAGVGVQAAFNPDRRAWAHSQSTVLPLRWQDYEQRGVELNRQMTGFEQGGGAIRNATDHANWAAWREMDGFLSHAIWEMAYAKATQAWQVGGTPMSHEEAVRAADKAVTMMMPAQDVYDQSSFVRDRSVAGFSYLVKNFPNTLANVAALNWWDARVGGGGVLSKTGAAAKFVGMVMAAEILGKAIIMRGGPGEQPTEDWLLENTVTSLFYPYMISEPGIAAYHALQGNRSAARRDMDRMMPSAFSIVASGLDDVARLVSDGDEEAGYRAAAHLMSIISRNTLPMKIYDLSNAVRNADSATEAAKKGLGYRQ